MRTSFKDMLREAPPTVAEAVGSSVAAVEAKLKRVQLQKRRIKSQETALTAELETVLDIRVSEAGVRRGQSRWRRHHE